jgi:gamma-glutamylcyclotransferase (GGCT)/AIG2-like uncharacterized protein YtfP
VYLPKPLLPNDKVNLSLMFTTYYDRTATRRRMQMYNAWGFTHFNGVQWYPKISVYDAKFGWDTYQHLNKEFYGDFGSFDVQLDFPSNYIVEGTGVLQNKNEVLPDSLLRKIDIKNFAKAKPNYTPSIIIPYEKGKRKIWKFHADNVHDFAFTADPSYRMSIVDWEGIKCVGLVQEPHAATWQNSAYLVAKIIQTFSRDFGHYQYPKMVAADANDGMEYPMLTLDGGGAPKPPKKLYIFSYGSNSSKQLKERLGGSFKIQRAYLDNYVRIFAGYSKYRKGGVASIHRKQGERVYGSITEISEEQLETLDQFELGYTRKKKFITLEDTKTRIKCFVYIKDDTTFKALPSIDYLKAIRKMLDEGKRANKSNILIRVIHKRKLITLGYFDKKIHLKNANGENVTQ